MRIASLLHTILLSTALSTSIVSTLPTAFAHDMNSGADNTMSRAEAPANIDPPKQVAQRRGAQGFYRVVVPTPPAAYPFDAPRNAIGERIDSAGIPLVEDRSLEGG